MFVLPALPQFDWVSLSCSQVMLDRKVHLTLIARSRSEAKKGGLFHISVKLYQPPSFKLSTQVVLGRLGFLINETLHSQEE